jgi:alkylation response protein AidB-like acyl-CoA dehydrogenase
VYDTDASRRSAPGRERFVDLDLSSDQELVRDTTARFVESVCPLETVRGLADGDADSGADYRRQAAELGWFAMLVPEDLGGGNVSGNGVMDASIIAEERGRLLQPGAFVPTNVVAVALVADGDDEQRQKVLPQLVGGDGVATWAVASGAGDWTPGVGVRATARGGGFLLSGTAGFVQDADRADWILVTAAGDTGLSQFLVPAGSPGLTVKPLAGLDITRRFCEVRFDDAELAASSLVGTLGGAAATVDRQLDVAIALTVAEMVGAMDRDFEVALEYAKARTAFGRPIGSFQAVKHLLADTSLALEMSKAMAVAAARAVGRDADDAREVASMAKAFVGDSAIDLAQGCFQVFGGIGYTWEHDQHLYLRRLTTDAALYGDASWHRERICRYFEL